MKLTMHSTHLFLTLSATVFSAVPFTAQNLQVVQADREVEAGVYGYDYEFDDGVLQSLATSGLGTWADTAVVALDDYYGVPIVTAPADQVSNIEGRALSVELTADAATAGNLFLEDAGGNSSYAVDFRVREAVRFRASASAELTFGYNLSGASLRASNGPALFSFSLIQVGSDAASTTGWLMPGDYSFDASLEIYAGQGPGGSGETQSGNLDAGLVLYHAGDFDMDDAVRLADRGAFLAAWSNGSPSADVDGDGDVDGSDRRAFLSAWRRGMGRALPASPAAVSGTPSGNG